MWKTVRSYTRKFKKVNGFSTPIGGLQWEAPPDEKRAIRKLIVFLEDRTTLYAGEHARLSDPIASLGIARREITETLGLVEQGSPAEPHLRQMRQVLKCSQSHLTKILRQGEPNLQRERQDSAEFQLGLAEMRGALGANLAALASIYDLEVESCLATLFSDDDGEEW